MKLSLLITILVCFGNAVSGVLSGSYDIRAFGAAGDGMRYDTEAIQSAIDTAAGNGGGVVYFPPGRYLIKTIILKDSISLHIGRGATLLGSTEMQKPAFDQNLFRDSSGQKFGNAFIIARDAVHIGITGEGIIDGQGYEKYYPKKEGISRPSLIRLIGCRFVNIENITLLNSAAWVQHYIDCEDLRIKGITVRSYSNKNNDGLDIDGCERVWITGCNIDSEDDAIVLKSLGTRPCRDVVISDCIISGLKSAIKTGTESLGGFENITVSNCTIYGTRGISLLNVDGGSLNNITISNISMRDSYAVIVMRLGDRMRGYAVPEEKRPKKPGIFRNISIQNIQATGVTESNDFIAGIPGHRITDVLLKDIRIEYAGGGSREDAEREIPELSSEYPKAKMFGSLPAYGFYIRHAQSVTLENIRIGFIETDFRSAIMCEDVEDLIINDLLGSSAPEAAPFIQFRDTRSADIRFARPLTPVDLFLSVTGESGDIRLIHNDLRHVTEVYHSDNQSAIKVVE